MTNRTPVAIIGMSGLMPGAIDLAQFWERLMAGDDLVTEVPETRWNWRDHDGDPNGEGNVTSSRWGGFTKNVERFDAGLFGISPREAESLDPQQRLLLCAVWEALESAAVAPSALAGSRTGVFIGASGSDFKSNLEQPGGRRAPHQASGTHQTMLANRISFQFDLHGPSETLDTACSSSLVAIHRAAMALGTGEIEMALAGGINLLLNPEMTVQYSKAGMLSPDGRCHTFDHRANGYVRSEGLGVVVLKTLDRALADGDPIQAVIRGSAVNHGGKANSLTAPNPRAQTALIVDSVRSAGIAPDSIGLVEAHGTGTALGDPIEINALKAAFKQLGAAKTKEPWCALGAVKTATGHLEAAAGVAGLFKAVFSMQNGVLPANLHHERTNPHIDLAGSPFFLATGTRPWRPHTDAPLRATVSSFGFGGVNAHVVVEQAPPVEASGEEEEPRPHLFVLSAPDPERLAEQAARLLGALDLSKHLSKHPPKPAGAGAALAATLLRHASERLGRPLSASDATSLFCDIGLGLTDVRRLCERMGVAAARIEGLAHGATALADLTDSLVEAGPAAADEAGDECLLIRALPRRAGGRASLRDIAWTLSTGRHLFDERAAIVASTHEELAEGLAAIATGRPAPQGSGISWGMSRGMSWFRNNPRRGRIDEVGGPLAPAAEACRSVAFAWLNEKRPKIDWDALFPGTPRRLVLPGLALRLKRYPLGNTDGHLRAPVSPVSWQSRLLGENLSDLRQFRFRRRVAGNDAVWLDTSGHDPLRQSLRLFEAVVGAIRTLTGEDREIRVSAMAWAAPEALRVGDELHVVLAQPGPDLVAEVARRGADGTERLLCQTDAMLEPDSRTAPASAGWRESPLGGPDGALWSDRLADGLRAVLPSPLREGWAPFRIGSARVCQAVTAPVARLRLRLHGVDTGAAVVDLELLDGNGALHSRIDGLELRPAIGETAMAGTTAPQTTAPETTAPVTRLARFDWQPAMPDGEPRAPDRLLVLDNEAGAPLARALGGRFSTARTAILSSRAADGEENPSRHRLRLGAAEDWTGVFADVVGATGSGTRVDIVLPATELFGDGATMLDRVLNAQSCLMAIARSGLARLGVRSVRAIVPAGGPPAGDPAWAASVRSLDAWGRSLRMEDSPLEVLVLDLGPAGPSPAAGTGPLLTALEHGVAGLRRLDGGRWLCPRLCPLDAPAGPGRLEGWRGGSVLVSGGLGALSRMFAEHLSDRYDMSVHLCGRRPADPAVLERWRRDGRRIAYHSADIADAGRVRDLVTRIVAADGRLNGVLHCAGVIRDKMTARKTAADLREVLSPKLAGALALDAATADRPLDFFVLFGSVVGAFGNPGQADYAYANAWLGGFAEWRRDEVAAGRRSGRTLSIDWPHWEDGGMVMSDAALGQFRARHGLQSLGRDDGLAAFERALATDEARVVVLHGRDPELQPHFSTPQPAAEGRPAAAGVFA